MFVRILVACRLPMILRVLQYKSVWLLRHLTAQLAELQTKYSYSKGMEKQDFGKKWSENTRKLIFCESDHTGTFIYGRG